MVRAICSVPLRWKVTTSDVIVFETIETTVSVNSGWMNFYRKHLDIKALADRIASGFPTEGTEDGEGDVALAQPVDLEDLCAALNLGFAKRRNGDLRPGSTEATLSKKPGLHNVAAFFVTSSARYSEVAIQDLDALAKQTEEEHGRTALGTIFGLAPPKIAERCAVIEPVELTYSQLAAVRSALTERLTVITGPPGTGKSQVVTAILASAAAQGRTVLFASRNHAALDAVEPRLEELSPTRPFMIRLSRRWGDRPVRLSNLIRALVAQPVCASDTPQPETQIVGISTLDLERASIMDRATRVARGRQAISGMEAELTQLLAALQLDVQSILELPIPKTSNLRTTNNSPHLLRQLVERIVCWLQLLLCRRRHEPIWERFGCPAPTMSSLETYGHWVTDLSRAKYLITKIRIHATDLPTEKEQLQDGERLELLNTQIRRDMSRLLPSLVKSFDLIDDSDRQRLMEIRGNTERSRISGADVATILRHYPVWALSNLTVARFAPPEPLFDYVVIDEASQCDIASALPLLARARRAVIVGDPAQLGVVSTLSPDWEAEILDSFGLS
jgi:hypothetical protein